MTPLTPLRAPRRPPLLSLLCLLSALPACGKGQGQWAFELWTPEATRAAPTLLEDGCTLTWSAVDVVIGAGYIDIPDDRVVEVGGPGAWDLLYERVNVIGENEVTASDEATVGLDLLVTDQVEEGNPRSTQESLLPGEGLVRRGLGGAPVRGRSGHLQGDVRRRHRRERHPRPVHHRLR